MSNPDFLIVGGGIAGLSAAARLVRHGKVVVLEAEEALGYHSSGRSVSFSHYGIGNAVVRGLTAWSRSFFESQPEGFSDTPVARLFPSIYFANEASLNALIALRTEMAQFIDTLEWVEQPDKISELCPALRIGGDEGAIAALVDPTGLKLDADVLLQSFARAVRAGGGHVLTGRRIASATRQGGTWEVKTEQGETWSTPVLIDAAGSWGDHFARLAGVRPIGLQPKRRTIIAIDPPAGTEIAHWPFVHSAAGDFYMLPEAGQLLVSPVDEVDDDPCDAQPEDYDIALAAWQVERYTTLPVARIAHRWAGLRSFVGDRTPTAGFDPETPGFFWLVGQGGYGLQTAPAMSAIVEALATGGAWPEGLEELGVPPERVKPERLFNQVSES